MRVHPLFDPTGSGVLSERRGLLSKALRPSPLHAGRVTWYSGGDMVEPRLYQIKTGWAAAGEGWAVHARTREDVIKRFREAEKQHEKIRRQPPFYEQE